MHNDWCDQYTYDSLKERERGGNLFINIILVKEIVKKNFFSVSFALYMEGGMITVLKKTFCARKIIKGNLGGCEGESVVMYVDIK